MPELNKKLTWEVIGETVQGATHVRSGLENQDSIDWRPKDKSSPKVILAVSDGHGSSRSFRSSTGSKLATTSAMEALERLAADFDPAADTSTEARIGKSIKELVQAWTAAVERDCQEQPLSADEKCKLGDAKIAMAYGATLVMVLVSESCILYLQLGDGDILTVSESGQVMRPLPADARLFANETTSLCLPNAWADFRAKLQLISDEPPALIMISTDGYANSFQDDEAFKRVGSDIFGMLCEPDGANKIRENVRSWLLEATTKGSGDDISLGIIYRNVPMKLSSPAKEPEKVQVKEPENRVEVVPESPINPQASTIDKLRLIIRLDALEDRVRREGLLKDIFNERGQISVLAHSLRERVPQSLRVSDRPLDENMSKLTNRLKENGGLTEEHARWAVKVWAEALDLHPQSGQEELAAEPSFANPEAKQNSPLHIKTAHINAAPSLDAANGNVFETEAGSLLSSFWRKVFHTSPSPKPTRVVSPDGSGDFTSIGDAVQKAGSNARVVIRPGIYRESIAIDAPLEIVHDGHGICKIVPSSYIYEIPRLKGRR